MTVYGYFGTMAETALKYTRDFSKFPIIIRAADLNHRRKTDDTTNTPLGGDSDRFFRMQIVTEMSEKIRAKILGNMKRDKSFLQDVSAIILVTDTIKWRSCEQSKCGSYLTPSSYSFLSRSNTYA